MPGPQIKEKPRGVTIKKYFGTQETENGTDLLMQLREILSDSQATTVQFIAASEYCQKFTLEV